MGRGRGRSKQGAQSHSGRNCGGLPLGSVLTTACFLSDRYFSFGGSTQFLTPSRTSGRACFTVTGMALWGSFFPIRATLGCQCALAAGSQRVHTGPVTGSLFLYSAFYHLLTGTSCWPSHEQSHGPFFLMCLPFSTGPDTYSPVCTCTDMSIHDQNKPGEKKAYFGLEAKVGTEAETTEESCLLACSATIPIVPRPACLPMVALPIVGQALPYGLVIKKMPHRPV